MENIDEIKIDISEDKSESLKKIEAELSTIANKDKQNWSNFYILLKTVEVEQLWSPAFRSFSAWVKDLAGKTKMHESTIWNRKKAGETYQRYASVVLKKHNIEDVADTDLSQDTLILIDKIAKKNTDIENDLIEKAINKELTQKDLKQAYQTLRATNDAYKTETDAGERVGTNAHVVMEQSLDHKEVQDVLRAVDLVEVLSKSDWLDSRRKENKKGRFSKFQDKNKYSVYPEFPVFTGSSRTSRRIDLLVAENMTTENSWDICLHSIEIKVSKSDLVNDKKYTEYKDFVDNSWLAIPEHLVEIALEIKDTETGVIVVRDDGSVRVIDVAEDLEAERKIETLTTLALKLI